MVAAELEGGFKGIQCENKFKNLKRTYMKCKDANRQTGAVNQTFDYMDNFNDIFQKDHNVTPPVLASNLDVPQIDREDGMKNDLELENDTGIDDEPPRKKRIG